MAGKVNLRALSEKELHAFFEEQGLPRFRAGQLLHWMYARHARNIDEITEFSKDLRKKLDTAAYLSNLRVEKQEISSDGTEKYLFALEDDQTIESVLIPDKDRLTLCISSQVGCAMGCKFCLTGRMGLVRNLQPHEIVDQVTTVDRMIAPGKRVTNLVLMGMGEPLANLDAVVEALWRLTRFSGISKRRITLSTSGLAPRLAILAEKGPEVNLAISLNASRDDVRSGIMPVNKTYPLRTLLDACRRFPLGARRRITFEYVLIQGVNDSDQDAAALTRLLRGIRCKINLIPLNPYPGSGFSRPAEERVAAFQDILLRGNYTALIRESRGRDIRAACGQLKGQA